MRSLRLKVKIKTLAAESVIIRKELQKLMGVTKTYRQLQEHRVNEVRKEARDSLIAYGFLNGLHYADMEASFYEEPNWSNIRRMINKYGPDTDIVGEENESSDERLVRFEQWKTSIRDNRGMFKPLVAEITLETTA